MARRNRKKRVQARLLPAPFVGFAVLIVTMLLVYLWMDTSCGELGQQIRKLETRCASLDDELRREENRWTAMKSPENIEQALVRHGLNMTLPRGEQIVRLSPAPQAVPYQPRPQVVRR